MRRRGSAVSRMAPSIISPDLSPAASSLNIHVMARKKSCSWMLHLLCTEWQ